jgi:integrase
MEHIKFYLRPTKENDKGMLCHYVIDGQKVIERKSYKIKIPKRHWDNKRGRVKNTHPDFKYLNKIIDDTTSEFEYQQNLGNGNPEKQCVLVYFQTLLKSKKNLSNSSLFKYNTILKNLKVVTKDLYGEEYLPFYYFRSLETVTSIRNALSKSRKVKGEKSSNSLKNYLGRIAEVIKHWNASSGTTMPINTFSLTNHIGKDVQKYARVMSEEEFESLKVYEPEGIRGGLSERMAQKVFLFQFYSGGMRIQDILLLTNKSYKKGMFKIPIRKSKKIKECEACYGHAESLKPFYPKEFEDAERQVELSDIEIDFDHASFLAKLEYDQALASWDIGDLMKVEAMTKQADNHFFKIHKEIFETVKYQMYDVIAIRFFEALKKLDERFLFPYLTFEDFKEVGINSLNFTTELEYKIHRARAKHNSALKRITSKLGIEQVTGHTPRHTVTRLMLINGKGNAFIQNTLGHQHFKTTEHYTRSRHPQRKTAHEFKKFVSRF